MPNPPEIPEVPVPTSMKKFTPEPRKRTSNDLGFWDPGLRYPEQ